MAHRFISHLVIHCTAGHGDLESVLRFWKKTLGWRHPGYHFFIDYDGTVHQLAPINNVTNGVKGYNSHSVHISYRGGVRKDNNKIAEDTRTPEQKAAILDTIRKVLEELKPHQDITGIKILGHRDFSPDQDGNGVISAWERIKECPCYDCIPEYEWITKQGSL